MTADADADMPAFDTRAFRTALGHYATGVAIIAGVDAAGAPYGLTINSFASVSLDPPLVLWSIGLESESLPAVREAGPFSISILNADQNELAMRFAKSRSDRFSGVDTWVGASGAPIIAEALAWFDCQTHAIYPGGDHEIILGRVIGFGVEQRSALGFHHGKFLSLPPRA
jgi:4-hydroxyphenylacetate 3-hydroxylase, reductase component